MRTIDKGNVTLDAMMGPHHKIDLPGEELIIRVPWTKFLPKGRWAACVFRSGELGRSKQRWRPEAFGKV